MLVILGLYPSTRAYGHRPKSWWLAQNKFYGLAQAKATPIGILRTKLEDALRAPNNMRIPEKILNLEAEGNRKYRELHQLVLQETQAAKKGASKTAKPKPTLPTRAPQKQNPKPSKPVASGSKEKGIAKASSASKASGKPNATASRAPAKNVTPVAPRGPRTKLTARKTTGGQVPRQIPKIEEDGFEFSEYPKHRVQQTARKTTGGMAPRKRSRSPGGYDEGPSNKRIRSDDDDTGFGYLTGTYDISAPKILGEWDYVGDNLQLIVTLDSERRLFGAFDFGILSGVLRSTVDIEPRADGASAKFEWCGREQYSGSEVYTPKPRMKGVLRFTRRKRDGRHTIKGAMEDVPAVGTCDFTGEKVDDAMGISDDWDDFNEEAYEEANRDRWR